MKNELSKFFQRLRPFWCGECGSLDQEVDS